MAPDGPWMEGWHTTHFSHNGPSQLHGASRAAKFAALLCQAAPDPAEDNRTAAITSLCDYIRAARDAATRAAATAAQRGPAGGQVQLGPEALLPWTVYLCAHHPDFPDQEDIPSVSAEVMASFSGMLQVVLVPLLRASEASASGSSYSLLAKTLLCLLRARDATPDTDATPAVHAMADLGLRLLDALSGKGEGAGRHARAAGAAYPGGVTLSRRCFRMEHGGAC